MPSTDTGFLDLLRTRSGGLCIAVAEPSGKALWQSAQAAVQQGAGLVELRLDALARPQDSVAGLQRFCAARPEVLVLATCRRSEGGGAFRGSIGEQLALLELFAEAGARLVDVELETMAAASPEQLAAATRRVHAAGAHILVSAHDFQSTGDLEGTLRALQALGAPLDPLIFKVVSTATSLADNLTMLRFLEKTARQLPVVGMCMGAAGVPSRVLALRSGALFTFAAADGSQGTAPGQLSAYAMRTQYRAHQLTAQTRIYGIAGNPVTHSLSPLLHNAGFAATGRDAVYLPLHTEYVDDLWAFSEALPVDGLSVTMPWKIAMFARLQAPGHGLEPEAAHFGAINTVVRREDGSFYGANTDIAAIVEPLEARLALEGARILLLGAGGAARAAAFGLQARGARVSILNRTAAAASALAKESGAAVADPHRLQGFTAVVNATPAGMLGPSADELAVQPSALDDAQVVFDMVYRPTETPLIRLARSRGIAVITGDEMFLHQAAGQWRLWTRTEPPMNTMQKALQFALSGHPIENIAAHGAAEREND